MEYGSDDYPVPTDVNSRPVRCLYGTALGSVLDVLDQPSGSTRQQVRRRLEEANEDTWGLGAFLDSEGIEHGGMV